MKLTIPTKPLSVNDAWKGRRSKTDEYKKYEIDVSLLLKRPVGLPLEGELFVVYIFYLKNYGNSDTDNFVKQTQDILVKMGIFKDDRYNKAILSIKERISEKENERVEVILCPYTNISSTLSTFISNIS